MSKASKQRRSESRKRADRIGLLGLLSLLAATAPAWAVAQQTAQNVRLALRPPAGYVGEEVRFPLYLEGSGAEDLRHFSFELRFPRELMSFSEIEPGFLLQDRGASVEHRTVTRDNGLSALVVDVTSDKGLPDGLLLYLRFRVAPSAPLGGEIPLEASAQGTAASGGSTAITVPFTADPFRISPRKKEDEFIFACFFYMH